MIPYKIKKEYYLLRSCLVDARRMVLFMFEQVFLLMGEVWSMHDADTPCRVGEGRRPTDREEHFIFKFFLPCHKI